MPALPAPGRPVAHVDAWGFGLADPDGAIVGIPRRLGRDRMLYALATNGTGPVQIQTAEVVVDAWGMLLEEPQEPSLAGRSGLYVHRMQWARWTEDTRPF
jgi:hypothetical protein